MKFKKQSFIIVLIICLIASIGAATAFKLNIEQPNELISEEKCIYLATGNEFKSINKTDRTLKWDVTNILGENQEIKYVLVKRDYLIVSNDNYARILDGETGAAVTTIVNASKMCNIMSLSENCIISTKEENQLYFLVQSTNTSLKCDDIKINLTSLNVSNNLVLHVLNVTNLGPEHATGVYIKSFISNQLNFKDYSYSADGGKTWVLGKNMEAPVYDNTTGIWTLGTLESGKSKTIAFREILH